MKKEKIRLNDPTIQEICIASWLITMPMKDEGYVLNKEKFWDLIKIRHGWTISRNPSVAFITNFNINQAFACQKGGLVILHKELLKKWAMT